MRKKIILILQLTASISLIGLHAAKKNTPVWASLDAPNIPASVKIDRGAKND